jgi:hypothetical protein
MVTATGFPDDGFPFPLIDIPSSATSPEGVGYRTITSKTLSHGFCVGKSWDPRASGEVSPFRISPPKP